jgi:hypothetical protein
MHATIELPQFLPHVIVIGAQLKKMGIHGLDIYSLRFKIKITFGHKLCYKIKVTFGEIALKLCQTNWNVAENNVKYC